MKIFYSRVFKNYFLMMITLFATEVLFRLISGYSLGDWALLRIFIGINVISLLLGMLFSFCGRIAGNILTFITSLAGTIYTIAQMGFLNFLGVYVSFGTSDQAGAVKDYVFDYIKSFKWQYYLVFVPIIILLLIYIFIEPKIRILETNDTIDFSDKFDTAERKKSNELSRKKKTKLSRLADKVVAIIFIAILSFGYYASLTIGFMQNKLQIASNKELFFNPDIPNIAVTQFGTIGYFFVDVRNTLFGSVDLQDDSSPYDEGYTIQEQEQTDYTRTIDDTLWKLAIENETNSDYKKLNNYYISQTITDKNEYTGEFENMNLIVIMMESTTNIVLNEKYYPNMYKLYTEGWAWTNAYSPRNSCSTGNNEVSGMTSLYTINKVCTARNYVNNVYPYAIFNLFDNAGYTTKSFHDYTDQYYPRTKYHPNMGSQHYYGVKELGIPYDEAYVEWPSDVDLVDKVLEKIDGEDGKFMYWLTSVSAHQTYTSACTLCQKHIDLFKDTGYNITLKRYMSKLKEFDLAIGELLDGLEERGILDNTVIVLYADHYPYGLTDATLNSYFDYNVSINNEKDRTPFIIYNSKMTAKKYDEYTSYMNILPTVANLFDLDYDPRLYAGFDLLSDSYENRVVFADGSWKDPYAFYNASTGKVTYASNSTKTYSEEELLTINTSIKNRIKMSNLAIKTDYFNHLEEAKNKLKISQESTSN